MHNNSCLDSAGVTVTIRDPQIEEDYSKLGLQENDIKNNYHVITINDLEPDIDQATQSYEAQEQH